MMWVLTFFLQIEAITELRYGRPRAANTNIATQKPTRDSAVSRLDPPSERE
jgi:hypothetical protein